MLETTDFRAGSTRFVLLSLVAASAVVLAQPVPKGPDQFLARCAICHGSEAGGTDRGPALVRNRHLRVQSLEEIKTIIHGGLPGGMPGFALPESELTSLAKFVASLNAPASAVELAGDVQAGQDFFFGAGQCSSCHMVAGQGIPNGPDLSTVGQQMTVQELRRSLLDPGAEIASGYGLVTVQMRDGKTIRGFARNEGSHSIQVQTFDGKIHSVLEPEWIGVTHEPRSYMPVLKATDREQQNLMAFLSRQTGVQPGTVAKKPEKISAAAMDAVLQPKAGNWPTYYGSMDANRRSPLTQINAGNAGKLGLQWMFTTSQFGLESTPIVADGAMFVTGANQVYSLDARTGRALWHWSRPRTAGGIAADATRGANRGVAVLGDRVFFVTDNAHLICLHRLTGALLWEVVMPDRPGNYGGTGAPLVVGDLVITGVAGADDGIRGFIDAYEASSGRRPWRFWTVPNAGEPGSETWQGDAVVQGGGSSWLTGSYDPESGLLFWPTGNPYPDTDGEDRKGDNLYTDCIVALDARTGKLKWYFQFTPHDLHDWDAVEPPVLVNTQFRGSERKLLLQANRNGFFYVLDRNDGKVLLAKPFVHKLTWASGIGPGGRPILLPANETTLLDTKTCPAVRGATNWYSSSFDPGSRLFYVMAVEDCGVYKRSKNGGFGWIDDPHDPAQKFLRALDIDTGKVKWELPQVGPPENNYSGVLSTAGGVLFYGETSGGFAAVESKTGHTLWHFETNNAWKSSPMTYMVDGRQYVAVVSGASILSFALTN